MAEGWLPLSCGLIAPIPKLMVKSVRFATIDVARAAFAAASELSWPEHQCRDAITVDKKAGWR